MTEKLKYQSGFGNHFATEALPDALPKGQNSPQKAPYSLYPEQVSGTSFLAPRAENQRSWLYRILPSVRQSAFEPLADQRLLRSRPFAEVACPPDQMRWDPVPIPEDPTDFLEGLITMAGNGDAASVRGSAAHVYAANRSMTDRFFYNADGEFLIVPQQGRLIFRTEFGVLDVRPGEIAVIQRGIRYQVVLPEGPVRGYVCENYGPSFRLPYLGPIGANGLANPRDFQTPVASFEERGGAFQLIAKFQGKLWQAQLDHSPLDVVAWHGNYAPYKYDLSLFQAVNTVSFDHSDPSIFTVLQSPSELPGVSNVDFVIFPPRWQVAEHTFRPPYFHRNVMSEFMGLIFGLYEAKLEGFLPGGASLHNCMSAHGPDAETYEKAVSADLKPQYMGDTLAFMFESSLVYSPTAFALNTGLRQKNYLDCWRGLKAGFNRQEQPAK
jgi:homogentisate 1,2-dioxygenase